MEGALECYQIFLIFSIKIFMQNFVEFGAQQIFSNRTQCVNAIKNQKTCAVFFWVISMAIIYTFE